MHKVHCFLFICLLGWANAGRANVAGPNMAWAGGDSQEGFRVLVVASRAKDHQKMIAAARPFFEQMAVDNHFGLDFTDDTSVINTVNLKRYSVFVLLQLAPFDMSSSQQLALQQFVEAGNGWVGIHAAGLTGREFLAPASEYWEWFENFMGGVLYSPHPAFQTATLHVDDHYHPLMAHMPSRVNWADEWYEWTPNPRGRVHVLATVDESTYHPNKPMGDHPIIWTNERYRRMVYIGPGHDPALLKDSAYARLLRDAILWAASGDPLPPITMQNGGVDYGGSYDLPGAPTVGAGYERVRKAIGRAGLPLTVTRTERDTIGGTAMFKVMTGGARDGKRGKGEPVKWFWMKFDWTVTVMAGRYIFHSLHYYEKPVGPGVSNEFSKIEYRWGDYRAGHPWSVADRPLFRGIDSVSRAIMEKLRRELGASVSPRFRVLALYENGGHHVEYTARARVWLAKLAADSNFSIDYLTHTDSISDEVLASYRLILQLDFVPYGWKPAAMAAFQRYIEEGRGGWVGLHHASLLGEFDGYPMWPWFHDFLGGVRWKDYIARFARGTVHVEDGSHPVMKGIPDSFVVQKEEWYTYDKSPRPNVHVLANVDESSYQPDTTVKMGDHPVVWTNEKMKARNVYIFMGHSPVLFDDWVYRRMLRNAIVWAAAAQPPPGFRALAFYSNTVEGDHVAFAYDAIRFYSDLAARQHFVFDTTSDWAGMSRHLSDYGVVVWLNDFPHTEEERAAFSHYMDSGGAWLGCHVSAYNDRDTHWPWFVNFLGGAVFLDNSWPPLPAKLVVEDRGHPAALRLPGSFIAPINEWYGWKPDPRLDKDVRVLLSLDTMNYPLGKKDILRSGDVPVVWTNTRYRMLYLNMGHGDQILSSPVQNNLFEDGLLWLGNGAKH
jgi:type 1 glutamine amidotransferase